MRFGSNWVVLKRIQVSIGSVAVAYGFRLRRTVVGVWLGRIALGIVVWIFRNEGVIWI